MRDSTTFAPVSAVATRTEIGSMSTASKRTRVGCGGDPVTAAAARLEPDPVR